MSLIFFSKANAIASASPISSLLSRMLTAIQLFKAHKLSIGKSAALAGIRKEHFLTYLDQYRVPVIDYNADELEGELKRFKQ